MQDIETLSFMMGDPIATIATDCSSVQIWNGSTFSDETADSKSATTADVTLGTAVGSYTAIGSAEAFSCFVFINSTVGAGGVMTWEYSQGGGTWATISDLTFFSGNANMISANQFTVVGRFTPPADWVSDTVNGVAAKYVRCRVTTLYTTAIVGTSIGVGRVQTLTKALNCVLTSGRDFKTCFARVSGYASLIAGTHCGIVGRARVAGGSWTNFDALLNIASSGEQYTFERFIDLTTPFSTADAAGASVTLDMELAILHSPDTSTTNIISDVATEVFVNFAYDETAETGYVRRFEYPWHSTLAGSALTASLQTVHTVPAFNPEAGFSLIDAYLVVEGNSVVTAAGAYQIGVQWDSDAEILSPSYNNAANSGCNHKRVVRLGSFDPTVTHTIKLRCTTPASATCNWLAGRLILVYTATTPTPGSTTILCSQLKFLGKNDYLRSSTSDPTVMTQSWLLQETAPSLINAVCEVSFGGGSATTTAFAHSVKPPGDAGFTSVAALTRQGNGGSFLIKFPCASFPFARGFNTARAEVAATSFAGEHYQSVVFMSYKATCPATGWWDKANQYYKLKYSQNIVVSATIAPADSAIGEITRTTDYYLNCFNLESSIGWLGVASASNYTFDLTTGEGGGKLMVPIGILTAASEIGSRLYRDGLRHILARWPGDLRPRNDFCGSLNPNTSRTMTVRSAIASAVDIVAAYCLYRQRFSFTGTITGYSGDGSGITVTLHDSTTHEGLKTVTTAIGGTFTCGWHDDVGSYYLTAQQSTVRKGRSKNGTAASGFDIILKRDSVSVGA